MDAFDFVSYVNDIYEYNKIFVQAWLVRLRNCSTREKVTLVWSRNEIRWRIKCLGLNF